MKELRTGRAVRIRARRRPARTIEERVLAVRDAHPAWGARKIVRCLEREGDCPPAFSTVQQILRRTGRIKPPPGGAVASQRFEMPAPNLAYGRWTSRVGSRCSATNACHPLTMVDDHSRYASVPGGLRQSSSADRARQAGADLPPLWPAGSLLCRQRHAMGRRIGRTLDTVLGVWLLKLGIDVMH